MSMSKWVIPDLCQLMNSKLIFAGQSCVVVCVQYHGKQNGIPISGQGQALSMDGLGQLPAPAPGRADPCDAGTAANLQIASDSAPGRGCVKTPPAI